MKFLEDSKARRKNSLHDLSLMPLMILKKCIEVNEMNIIKRLKLRKLNKERECLLNEFTVEDITVQGVWPLGKSLNNAAKRACLMDGLERLDAKIKAIVEG